ncbi:Ionotropic receptor 186 [Blattella germanica]|nr:Ionotropic receptor 186 [Blattella germanica]
MTTLWCYALAICFVEVYGMTVESRAYIVAALNKYMSSSCVLLPLIGKQDINRETDVIMMQASLSQVGVPTLAVTRETNKTKNCTTSKPFFLFLDGGIMEHNFLKRLFTYKFIYVMQISSNTLSKSMWLIFLDGGEGRIKDFFSDIYIPLNCLFLVVQEGYGNLMKLYEVYRVAEYLPLIVQAIQKDSSSNMYLRRNKLHGLVFRNIVRPFIHLVQINRGVNNTVKKVTGYFGELWKELQEHLKFSTQYIAPPNLSFGGVTPNGSWDGLIGFITRGSADVSSNGFQHTRDRISAVSFLNPILETKMYVYIKKPRVSTNWDNFLSPFATIIWFIILVTIFIIAAFLSAAWYIVTRSPKIPFWFIAYEAIFRIFGNFCNQGLDMQISSSGCRAIIVTSHLTTTVLLAAYSAALISSLTVQDMKLPFSTYNDLLKYREYTLSTTAGTAMLTYFQDSPTPLLKQVYKKMLEPHLNTMPHTGHVGLKRICNRYKYAFFTTDQEVHWSYGKTDCDIIKLPGTSFKSQVGMIIAKNSPYKDILDYYIKQFMRTGVLMRLRKKYEPRKPEKLDPEYQELDILAMFPLLVVVLSGAVFSILVLTIELLAHRFLRRRRKTNFKEEKVKYELKTEVKKQSIEQKILDKKIKASPRIKRPSFHSVWVDTLELLTLDLGPRIRAEHNPIIEPHS